MANRIFTEKNALYVNKASRDYEYSVNVVDQTTCTLSDLVKGKKYSIAVTACNEYGNESDFSDELVYKFTQLRRCCYAE